jgi:hypothetical protein
MLATNLSPFSIAAVKGDHGMSEGPNENELQGGQNTDPSTAQATNESESSTRRELIGRYAKYAVIAAPLLMFVSKAQAIHSKPV